jgi:hypothetical protein
MTSNKKANRLAFLIDLKMLLTPLRFVAPAERVRVGEHILEMDLSVRAVEAERFAISRPAQALANSRSVNLPAVRSSIRAALTRSR